jgi:hypothetical protein
VRAGSGAATRPLADGARTGTEIRTQNRDPEALLADFRQDVAGGRLPAVSWIVAPEAYSEHPNWAPDYGAWYDLLVTVQGDPQFRYRYAGHLENGRDSISDPAMGGLVTPRPHPDR